MSRAGAMSAATELLLDGLSRVREQVHAVLDGLDEDALTARLDTEANTIGWLVWHLSRVQDDHVAGLAGTDQVWTEPQIGSPSWYERFGVPYPSAAIGYGQSAENVAQFRGVSAEDLAGYHDAVDDATRAYVADLAEEEFALVVDRAWDPPVTVAVRLVSVVNDCTQHVGQAAFIRGVLQRR